MHIKFFLYKNNNSINFVCILNFVIIWQAHPQEKVGVFVRRGKGGSLNVVEYSELEQSLASAVNQVTLVIFVFVGVMLVYSSYI